ncbi:hypothetical protein EK21DRAFT_108674 [Setomelanomma holmii]|uniref:FAD/NAD(P)-binding domain-containing protein n=1 Tax=Setomelanomma holmii TaxID=210430 RepID=A0A9P4LSL7_9PLEO|nr:hypothetical protein EK21DRAFT_108674 [Setomelanomma holmii]
MKSVCIVGAGPAGLVTAKTLLQKGGFSVTIFESADRPGGMWRAQPGDHGDKCSPHMRTNLSRFTVAFSDFSWSSADPSTAPPMFPEAWQVGKYLESYAHQFGLEVHTRYNTPVIQAKGINDYRQWEVTTLDQASNQSRTQTFDYFIVASGFFDKPMRTVEASSAGIQHSSAFRSVDAVGSKPGDIVVIGGGISGVEAAAQAAFQVSSLKHSPGNSASRHLSTKIHHVFNKPFYSLPRYIPQNPSTNEPLKIINVAPNFLPLDLVLYNLSRRGSGEISATISTVPSEKAQKGHEFLQSMIGSEETRSTSPAYTGISDTYTEFVRSGLIVPAQGWAMEVKEDGQGGFEAVTSTTTITHVSGVIEATGYKPTLDFLNNNVKDLLSYDPSSPRIPFLLSRGSVLTSKIPSVGFVGFYEGPYWGVMETQARLIAKVWSDPSLAREEGVMPLYSQEDAVAMRAAMKEKSPQVPQFWMADYVGLVEELARLTDIERGDDVFGGQVGPAFPSRYAADTTDPEATNIIQEVNALLQASNSNARFVAAAIFRGLQGAWKLYRTITGRHGGGDFEGTASFHPRTPTDPSYSAEYLYFEQGTFRMECGDSFPAHRAYVYRYNEATDKISAWFADTDGKTTTTLFNTWNIRTPRGEDDEDGWVAEGYHWCAPDAYTNKCGFRFRGATIQDFDIVYTVKGPNKDYTHESKYERSDV